MRTNRSFPILLPLFVPLTLRACTGVSQSDLATHVAGTEFNATQDAFFTQQYSQLDTAEALIATLKARATPTASPTSTAIPNTAPPPTSTDIVAIGPTPEAAALLTLKDWATAPYQNPTAAAVSKNDQQAQIKVSAEFMDNGAWVLKEAVIQCVMIHAGWKCDPDFHFAPAATPTPAP